MEEMTLHDAELIGVEHLGSEKRVNLAFKLGNGDRRSIVLESVQSFRMTDFIGQNVVSRVMDSRAGKIPEDSVLERLRWMYRLSDGSFRVDDDVISKSRDEVVAGKLRLFCVEPSWGAELACLCCE